MCACVCVSAKSHLTSGASIRRENAATYSAGNEGQNICGVFSETAPFPRSSIHKVGHFPADNTHAHCAYASLLQGSRECDARALCRKLSLRSI